jgi:rhodanese-related sulfurtransferase
MTDSISIIDLNEVLQSDNPPSIFDVRKKPAFDSDPRMISKATWQAFDAVEGWASNLNKDTAMVVYCVHGHEVSQSAARTLRELGFKAQYLEGGIATWTEAGFEII